MKVKNVAFGVLMACHTAHAMDWGSMDQYKGRGQTATRLNGNTIWISGKEGEGFDIVLSQETQSKVKGVIAGCGPADDKCYQGVLTTLQSADLELDSKLERRHLGDFLAKTAKGPWDIFFDIAAMLWINWKIKADNMHNSAFFLPQAKAEEAANQATAASVIHSAEGSVVITITPAPKATTLTGSAAPAITTAASDDNGHKKGDLLATLDAEMARKINEIVQRMTDCEDGRKFDNAHNSRKRATQRTYGQALCAAEGVIGMSGKGGAFSDLTLLSHDEMGIEFVATAAKAKDALLVLKDFIIAYGPMLVIPETLAEELGTFLLALIIDAVVIENLAIGPMNYIGPDLAVTYGAMSPRPTPTSTTSASSSSGCPNPSATQLSCGREEQDCEVQLPDRMAKGISYPVCADTKWKGCNCSAPVLTFENVIGLDEFKSRQLAIKLFDELKDRPRLRKVRITCRKHALSAPRRDENANGETSVEKAIDTWCRDNDGKDIPPEGIFWRWGITQLGVPNRSSYWLRAAQTCDNPGKFNRYECKKALMDGMEDCDKGPETHGLAASIACLDYSIDLSSTTDSAIPPWIAKPETNKFPPPEDAARNARDGKAYTPVCDKGNGMRPLADEDLNRAIDAFCQNGHQVRGFGKYGANMFDFPPEKTPQFYDYDRLTMHLKMGAEGINNNGGKNPYQDTKWCKDYDWKLGKDDCTYALHKLYKTCTKDRTTSLNGGEYTYRCVRYKSWAINMGK